ncbi:MAG TPA: hypothetical protein VEI97_16415 [bacterium]|nr:hypothetical protein [bacterium]
MATPQDIVDALNRLTAAMQALQAQQQAAQQKQAGGPTAPGRGPRPGKLGRTVGNLRRAWRAFQAMRGHARTGSIGNAIRAGQAAGRLAGRAFGGKGGKGGGRPAAGARAGGAATGAAGGAGAAAAVVFLLVEAFRKFKAHVESTTDALIAAQQRLAEVSPSMASVMARRHVQELMRDQKRGEALAASARDLTQAEQRRKDTTLPFEVAWDRIQNGIYALLNDVLTGMITYKPLEELGKKLKTGLGLDQTNADLADQIDKEAQAEKARKQEGRDRKKDMREKLNEIRQNRWG